MQASAVAGTVQDERTPARSGREMLAAVDMSRNLDQSSHHILSLDGIRGLAILMVFTFHCLITVGTAPNANVCFRLLHSVSRWGYCGVDLFFVLSGFLITQILLKTRNSTNFYRVFYIRRALRIFPLYYLAIAIVFLLLPQIAVSYPALGLYAKQVPFRTQIWFWLNMSNFPTAFDPLIVPVLTPFWSLAIEEQFYFVWPSVIRRFRNRALAAICVVGFLIPLVLRVSHAAPSSAGPGFYYRITPYHMEGLFAGAALALLDLKGDLSRYKGFFVAAMGLASAGVACSILWHNVIAIQQSLLTLYSLFFTGLVGICLLGHKRSFGLSKVFSARFLRALGERSYFIYVFHAAAISYAESAAQFLLRGSRIETNTDLFQTGIFPFALMMVYFAASLSKTYFEGPLLRLKKYFRYAIAHPQVQTSGTRVPFAVS
jgi:peptidoglycan/LPS O-acetylase OafA/YrhL